MARNDGPLSASYLNPIIADFRQWVIDTREEMLREFYASGHPPGTEPQPKFEQYKTLVAMKMSGSPEYWMNQEAQDDLRKLEEEFGPAPELTPTPQPPLPMQPPMQGMMPNGSA